MENRQGTILDVIFKKVPIIAHRCNATTFIDEERIGYLYDDLNDFDPKLVLNENVYHTYLKEIEKYISKQKYYKEKLVHFLESSNKL